MPTVPNAQVDPFTSAALAHVDAYIAAHPEYSRQGVSQPGQGATNRVVFARRSAEIVVFKVFCQPERRQREVFAFHHWQSTGLIPSLIAELDETTIVMSHLPGVYLHQARRVDAAPDFRQSCYEMGYAVGTLTRVPLSARDRVDFESRFYGDLGPLQAYLTRILALGRSITARDPGFRGAFWQENLNLVEADLPYLYAQSQVLYHQDVSNLHVQAGRFVGFFDLEMCRVGCAALQLASALTMFWRDKAGWMPFCAGWEAGTGVSLGSDLRQAALAAYSLLQWREISRYLSYDGTPGSGFSWASPADPVQYRATLLTAQNLLDVTPT
jgi:hypothetical protein